MIRVGIIGLNYGLNVLVPAFRADRRCTVVAIAGRDGGKAAARARETGMAAGFGDWQALVDDGRIDAVAIATPPRLQAVIADRALERGKAVFLEKPVAADLDAARALAAKAAALHRPAVVDFGFTAIPAWQRARAMLREGAIGALRHVLVTWNVENYATRMRLAGWKSDRDEGGGVLGNFASHCFHYLEWLCGPLQGLQARLFAIPGDGAETTLSVALQFRSAVGGTLAVSCASYLGSGHRLELYGEDGTLTLANPTPDYMRGFALRHGRRPATALTSVTVEDPLDRAGQDGRIAPASRLAARFLDAIERGEPGSPGLAEGVRAQALMAAARRSNESGRWIEVAAAEAVS